MSKMPRAHCAFCGSSVALTARGVFRQHRTWDGRPTDGNGYCAGTDKRPTHAPGEDVSSKTRAALGIPQAVLAHLLGVHEMTVSKWERGQLVPSEYQAALMQNFIHAAARDPGVSARVAALMIERGAIVALYELLHVSLRTAVA